MKHGSWKWLLIAGTAGAAIGSTAHAQTRAPLGGNPLDTLPQINAPARKPNVTVQLQQQNQQLQALLAHKITPSRIQVEGSKSIPFDEIAKRFTPLVGKEVTIGDLIATANGVTQLYQERGYALSFCFVPAQDFANNVVRVTVVEGYVSAVHVTGHAGMAESKIRDIAEHIRQDRPLRRATFERYINTLGLLPGVKINATVPPPQTTDGATTLDLAVERRAFNVATGIDFNHPGVQGLITATENGLTSFGEQLSVTALAPPGRDHQQYYAADGALPIGSNGLIARVNASRYRGEPTDNPGLPSSLRRTVVQEKLGVSASYPLLLSNTRSLIGTVSAYASHNEDHYANTLFNPQPTLGLRSQVRVLQTQLDYATVSSNQIRKASVFVAKALNVLGASKSAELTNAAGTPPTNGISLTFLKTGASFTQTNQWPWKLGTSVSLTAQYANGTLPTSEQIAFGGQRFGLGYEPGETSGDSGFGASFEINRSFALDLAYLKTITPYVTYDMARVYLHSGTVQPNHLQSVALGVRMSDNKYYNLDLSLGRALGDAPIESASRAPRINAAFSYQLY